MFSDRDKTASTANQHGQTDDSLFTCSPELKTDGLEKLSRLVKSEGLDALYEKLDSFPIGTEYYLHNNDLLHLATHDPHHSITTSTAVIAKQKKNNTHKSAMVMNRHPIVKEANGGGMEYLTDANFESWEDSIYNTPAITFFPKSIQGLKNLVIWAQREKKRLRAAGYRHTSADMYSQNNQVLVSMLNLETAIKLPAEYPKLNPYSDLQGIQLIGAPYEDNGKVKILCEIGSQTCNYHFQDWVHAPDGDNQQYAMPLNVILVEITFGGSNAMICHGAGINNKTISDLIAEIKFINVKGEEQIVNDKEQIKAAAGCFGLLGLVTSLTFELNKMTYANFKTVEKKLLALTVPPVTGTRPSPQLIKNLSKANLAALANQEELDSALQNFISRCENSYYAEIFWFPLHDQGWLNCWNDDGDPSKSVRYPDQLSTDVQKAGSYLAYLADNALGDQTPPLLKKIQTKLFSLIAMALLPDKQDITCTLEDAIHFRKGIQNFKTRMVEFEIPIPYCHNGKLDWSVCQQAWWDVINSTYSEENMTHLPMRTTLEMRIMGGSDMLMAAQHGNERTCSIEILTPVSVNIQIWDKFIQEILDKWAMLTDDNGKYLNIRPHWAKRFDHLYINRNKSWMNEWDEEQKIYLKKYVHEDKDIISIPMRDYLKQIAYKNQIPAFIKQMNIICKQGGYTFEDMLERFSNPLLADIVSQYKNILTSENGLRPKMSRSQFFYQPVLADTIAVPIIPDNMPGLGGSDH